MYSNYLEKVFDTEKRNKLLLSVEKELGQHDFDSFLVRGVSGITMGSILADRMGKGLIVARKNMSIHNDYMVEMTPEAKNFIFFDDMFSSGSSVRASLEELAKAAEKHDFYMRWKGCFFYNYINSDFYPPFYEPNLEEFFIFAEPSDAVIRRLTC
jgi:hypothetical protein